MGFKFNFNADGDYKSQMNEYASKIVKTTRQQIRERKRFLKDNDNDVKLADKEFRETLANRKNRIAVINDIVSDYWSVVGENPDIAVLNKLTDAILGEELFDSHPDKMTREDYPIESEYQTARRQTGQHRKKPKKGDLPARIEVPLEWAVNYGNDGINYGYPHRRERDDYENEYVNEVTVSQNKERAKKYRDFLKGKTDGMFTINIETGEKTNHKESGAD
jgi:hypothetical protein